MIRLERVMVTQFYLFEAEVVDLEEISGMFGPNGSGKSSLIDAVQIAMTGGNKNYIALNAQADDDKKAVARTVRSYCLGQYGESTEQRARQNARTYITLVWRNVETGEPLSLGICIYAYADRDKEEIRGRYVLPGVELSLGDHLEATDQGTLPRDWESFKHQIRERADRVKGQGHDPIYKDADRFVRAMLLALRGSGGVSDSALFLRAFRFALRMKFDKSIDSIVREDVLEANDTRIDKFKEVTESFRQLKITVERVEQKIRDGEAVASEYIRADAESKRMAGWGVLAAKVEVEIASAKADQCSTERAAAEEALRKSEVEQAQVEARILSAQNDLKRATARREGHSAHKNFGSLQASVQAESDRSRNKAASLASHIGFICRTLETSAKSRFLKDSQQSLLASAVALKELETNCPSFSPDALEAKLQAVVKIVKVSASALFKQGIEIAAGLREAQLALKNAKDGLDSTKSGKQRLPDNVKMLKRALEDRGLHPQPVCDLVRVADHYRQWQPAIEAYLGAARVHALLIPDGEEREAFRISRSLSISGVKVAMESRQQIGLISAVGSVAELLESNNAAALAYVQKQFGDLRRADTDAEALAGMRTLTKDGMLVSAGEFERLRLPSESQCQMGIDAREQLGEAFAEFEKCKSAVAALEADEAELLALQKSLLTLPNDEGTLKYLTETASDMKEAHRNAEAAMRQLEAPGNEEYVSLVEEERKLGEKIDGLSLARDGAIRAVTNANNSLDTRLAEEKTARDRLSAALDSAGQVQAAAGGDREFEIRQWDTLLEKHATNFDAMLAHCRTQEAGSRKRMETAVHAGERELGKFQEKHREPFEAGVSDDWRTTYGWISALIERLRNTHLVENKARMDQAYRTSQETFKNDVALALKERLDTLRYRINDLNNVLRKCPPFSNGERYQFSAVVRKPLEGLLNFVNGVANHGSDGGLFGGPGELPPEFKALLEEKATIGAGAKSPLEDYREFYEFDVEILREDAKTKTPKVIGHLSKRIGTGSGGEHRAPLYVIGGAALASAYRLSHSQNNGMRLMLLDEVFNKMDPTNITATMRYLEDLGLQLFMASPGENQGTLNAFMYRYYDVIRDVDNNSVKLEGHSLSAEVRESHRADLPEFNPALIEEEIELMRKESRVA